ncbi:SusC/RagA family TonB-linked outer membrane protein [Mangrovivirga cuniculi]|uniref:TonB-dependent receptor plug domain-containing protein n=1 Tax=Mangrovivirga cuniculi TaxID=2715131 RepID=A0A4D7JR39_9BACT|nr:SusC/RagA family TonB-linked outer membrane protein [Mangrovivirga cuniculi]QCK14116.1 hypothetical protein DCC35_04800 [Mangrovivirga cuniculi]
MRKSLLFFSAFLFMVFQTVAQDRTVTGKVTDESGEGIPGVNVVVKGTTQGTVTDVTGNYSLNVSSDNATLVFSSIGYLAQEIPVGSQSTIDVTMESDITELTEVVVTGYSSETRDKLSGSISTVNAQQMEEVPIPSFDQVLQGRSPGLYVSSGSGQPGSAANVRIRGNGSISVGNDPLYILDGVPITGEEFSALNSNDFESVSVLKDASATAIYGSRGANGVIVITSKQGKRNSSNISYRYQFGVTEQAREKFEMMNSEEKVAFEQLVGRGPAGGLDPNDPDDAALLEQYRNTNTDWKDIFTRNGTLQNHEVALSGGSDRTTYYASVGYLAQDGQAINSDLERYTFRLNLGTDVTEKLRLDFNSTVGYSISNTLPSEGAVALANPFAAVYLANPYEDPYDDETGEIVTGGGRTGSNTLELVQTGTRETSQLKGVISGSLKYQIVDQFYLKTTLGVDYTQDDRQFYTDPESFYGRNEQNGNQGSYQQDFTKDWGYVWTTIGGYDQIFGNHAISVIGGMEVIENRFDQFGYEGYGLNPKLPLTPDGLTPGSAEEGFIPVFFGGKTNSSLYSLFLVGNYTYNDKYNFKASIRRDGSSRFGENNQYAVFWSLGDHGIFLRNLSLKTLRS